MDDVDRAKDAEMNQRKRSVDAVRSSPDKSPGEEQIIDGDGQVICVDCLGSIPAERLDAKPDAVRCIYCKEDWERKQK